MADGVSEAGNIFSFIIYHSVKRKRERKERKKYHQQSRILVSRFLPPRFVNSVNMMCGFVVRKPKEQDGSRKDKSTHTQEIKAPKKKVVETVSSVTLKMLLSRGQEFLIC